MEPISSGPNLPTERVGSPKGLFEGAERPHVSGAEKKEVKESTDRSAAIPAVGAPTLPPPTKNISVSTIHTPQTPPHDDSPLVANDDDVMEREWVHRAKKIVLQTRDDPYMQEKQISKLQADYVKKRYGKDLKVSD
ncbi:MAG TPA: hypothetical protein VFT87_04745 [Candidatus Saccharimonadales bacterium]|nr:hypothetical protein [Candidatus Saccharimonadales bacterium]